MIMRPFLLVLTLVCALAAAAETPVNVNVTDRAAAPIVAEHDPFVTRIVVQNPYDQAVKVERIDATCTCAKQELAATFLLPRATTTLDLVIDHRDRSDEQRLGVTIFLTDPDLEPIEVVAFWQVVPDVAVDALAPAADALARPVAAFRDVYRYISKVRPDELHKLGKRIRLESPPGSAPEGGLRVLGIEYPGDLWSFAHQLQSDGSMLITASARDPNATATEGLREEVATVLTNHPHKARIALRFITYVGKDAGAVIIDPDEDQGKVKREGPPGPPAP